MVVKITDSLIAQNKTLFRQRTEGANRGFFRGLFNYFSPKPRGANDTNGEEASPTIFSSFEDIVRRFGDRTAVEYDGAKVNYSNLHAKASAISSWLPAAGANPGRVALLFENRIQALTAMFGVLKAGHAFVPLDAADPEERIRLILKDSEPLALLTDTENYFRARELNPKKCELINAGRPGVGQHQHKVLTAKSNDLAYIFYTSGSTGQPKGVGQTHRNLLYFIRCYCRTLGINENDRLSLLYSLSFSAANMDIFGGLLTGATVCAYDMRRRGIPALANWLDENQITILHAVPTVFRKLAASLAPGKILERVRAIDLGGEAVSASDVELFRGHFRPECLLVNHLAATEVSVIAQHVIDPKKNYSTDMLPVGYSPDEVKIRIERQDGSEAATDELGRIVIASPYVSPGYWRQQKLNKAVFFDDPARPGWRIFKTEDTGRVDADGMLHFLGREGTRVKIRGQSVDLAEVEAALRNCSGVRDAAVVAAKREEGQEADTLVAHVIRANPENGDAKKLRRELAALLPHYMIPSAFAFPESLPLTASGKIDRRTLRETPVPAVETTDDFSTPAGQFEERVAQIFQQVLKRDAVGRTDDFFLIGGDSMSAVELQIRLSDLAGRDIPQTDIFKDATVAGMAAMLEHLSTLPKTSAQSPVLVPLSEQGSRPPLFLVHGRLGQAPVSPHFLKLLGDDRPVYALQARGLNGVEPPNPTVEAMADDYLAAIRTVRPAGPYFLGGLCAGSYVAILMAQKLRAAGEKVLPLLMIDPPPPPPPFGNVAPEFAQNHDVMTHVIDMNLQFETSRGRFAVELGNPQRRQAAVQTAVTFEKALSVFKPIPYDGAVYLLASAGNLTRENWRKPAKLKSCFAGELQIFKIADTHGEMLDVHNETFARHLTACLQQVNELTGAKSNNS